MLRATQLVGFGSNIVNDRGLVGYVTHSVNFFPNVAEKIPVTNISTFMGNNESLRPNDYVVVVASIGHNLAATPSFSIAATGVTFTTLQSASLDVTSNDINCILWGGFIPAQPPSTIDVTFSAAADRPCEVLILVFRGVDPVTPLDTAVAEVTSTTVPVADPGSVGPTKSNSIVVAILCTVYNPTADFTIATYPYPNGQVVVYESDIVLPEQVGAIAACYKTPVLGGGNPENPNAFSLTETGAVGISVAYTLAIRML